MNKYIILMCILISNVAQADVPENQIKEVNHLLDYVRTSNCTINRNGTVHKGEKAVNHINKKYDYFREDIKTTEEFIEYSASKSTMSGKPYIANCPDEKPVSTQVWLLSELKSYRLLSKQTNYDMEYKVCKEPRPQICTMEYVPVCAQKKNKSFKTYASGCSACSDATVIKYKTGECLKNTS